MSIGVFTLLQNRETFSIYVSDDEYDEFETARHQLFSLVFSRKSKMAAVMN